MAINKLTNSDYKIKTGDGTNANMNIETHTVTIDGNLVVTGSQTTVSSTDLAITDNTIILNKDETGAGITAGSSGVEIERGTVDNATILFNETDDSFEHKIGTNYSKVRGGTPVDANDLTTKDYVDTQVSGGGAVVDKINEGNSKAEIFDDGVGTSRLFVEIDGTEVLQATATNLEYGNVRVSGNTISNKITGENLILDTDAGEIGIVDPAKLTEQSSDPAGATGFTKVYAKVPAGGGSGVYVANINTTDELVTKSKAIVFGLIF